MSGWLRLWLFVSALWAAFVWAIAHNSPGDGFLAGIVIPPLVVGVIGGLIYWVVRGFRRR